MGRERIGGEGKEEKSKGRTRRGRIGGWVRKREMRTRRRKKERGKARKGRGWGHGSIYKGREQPS